MEEIKQISISWSKYDVQTLCVISDAEAERILDLYKADLKYAMEAAGWTVLETALKTEGYKK